MYYMCVDMCSSYGGQKRATDALELALQMLGIKPGPAEEQPVSLTAEPSLQP